ncbi:MAG: histidinol dehydrogenase [Thermoproteota archaeon]|nr:histidinol dehydrogenase [Thermoproteota archaeon]
MVRTILVKHGIPEAAALRKSKIIAEHDYEKIKSIIDRVIRFGNAALFEYTAKLDGVKIKSLGVTDKEIDRAYEYVTEEQIKSLEAIKEMLRLNESKLLGLLKNISTSTHGIKVERILKPLDSVGCYIPGGMARYPSTLIMCAIPAKIAKVRRVVVMSPPLRDGNVDPLTLVAADICEVDEVYRIGGAQAIAALAYGTETISKVDKVVGPGGTYVNIAKLLVSGNVGIDMFAGPTELIVYADANADPRLVSRDLISQAEHSPDTFCGVVTTSKNVVEKVKLYLKNFLSDASLPRKDIVRRSISNNSFIALCRDSAVAISFINEFAPEHLEIIAHNPRNLSRRIKSAGVVLEGGYTPSSASDYCLGSNHVLPTMQVGKYRAGLSVLDFIKIVTHVSVSKRGLRSVERFIKELALTESLPNHYLAVKERLDR